MEISLMPSCVLVALFFALSSVASANVLIAPEMLQLDVGWRMQASTKVEQDGAALSRTDYVPRDWQPTSVPTTVLGALVRNGIYGDVFFGRNLEGVDSRPFDGPWWFRKSFKLPDGPGGRIARLIFEGINYRADVFLNGECLASADQTFGAFRTFELDVTKVLRQGENALAVRVFPPKPGDFTIGFVDWAPRPPDRNMGLFRPVKLRFTGPVSIEHPFVETRLDLDSFAEARLRVRATLVNHADREVSTTVRGELDSISFAREINMKPRERRPVDFSPKDYPALVVRNPRVWWPNGFGNPELYQLSLAVGEGEQGSDRRNVTFGIREVEDYINEQGHRGYKVNGRPVLIRGAGWADHLLLEEDPDNLETQLRYVRHMNLNTIRLEGFWGCSQTLYDLADRHGILLMTGWSCQWEWQEYLGKPVDDFGGIATPADMDLVTDCLRDQVLWLRHHPSIFVWVVGSDKLPRPSLERRYAALLGEIDSTRPVLMACKGLTSEVSGPTAVKMNGPYDYEPPSYWYTDTRHGGAFGFNTETGPGPQPPVLESIARMIPEDRLWPINEEWDFHCGRNEFNTLERYMKAFDNRYGKAEDVADFAFRAQAANYEAIRAMFEAFAVNRPNATGIIQWMLNAPWPKLYWQLYDHDLTPTGAFYGTRKAAQPLSLVYDYGDHSVHAVNQTRNPAADLTARVTIWDLESKKIFERALPVEVADDSSKKILDLPQAAASPVFFLSLRLFRHDGEVVADNFYWLSSKPDVLDDAATTWFYTPIREYADLTALNRLPQTELRLVSSVESRDSNIEMAITLENPGRTLAFFVELKVVGSRSGRAIVPVFWEDNYVSLLPGEKKTLKARLAEKDLGGERPIVRCAGYNVPENASQGQVEERISDR